MTDMPLRKWLAEFLGTALLLISVVGSGIMGESLAGGNTAIALLANAIATGCMLYVIITILGPISGAHFNPAVTIAFWIRKEMLLQDVSYYIVFQVLGGLTGVFVAHAMFGLEIFQFSSTARTGPPQWIAEAVATFGLLFVIIGGLKHRSEAVPTLVALYITGAYWFTASTSFANPAVTIARGFSDTFAGIDPSHIAAFVAVQIVTAIAVTPFLKWFFTDRS